MSALPTMQDEAAIRQLIRDLERAWNQADSHALARIFVEQGECRAINGYKQTGRDAIAAYHRHIFTETAVACHVDLQLTTCRFIRSDVAYVELLGRVLPVTHPAKPLIVTMVAVKQAGDWRLITACYASLLAEPPR